MENSEFKLHIARQQKLAALESEARAVQLIRFDPDIKATLELERAKIEECMNESHLEALPNPDWPIGPTLEERVSALEQEQGG